jgi:hypothetical protein
MTIRKRNDTWPALTFTPDGDDAAALRAQLTASSTAALIVRGTTENVPASALAGGYVDYDTVEGSLDAIPKVVVAVDPDDLTGAVTWQPLVGHVDTVGYWLIEVEYDLDGDGLRTVTAPTGGFWPMRIIEDLGDGA